MHIMYHERLRRQRWYLKTYIFFSPSTNKTQCKGCGGCTRPAGADEESDADYMMFLQATTKEKLDTLNSVHCAPKGLTAEDYGFVADVEELMAQGDGEITKEDYDNAYFSESEVDALVSKYCVDPSSSTKTAKSEKEEFNVKEMDSKSAKEKNKRTRNKQGK